MEPHPITGFRTVTLDGEQRTLRFDFNASAVLFGQVGEFWHQWLLDRFLGQPTTDDQGCPAMLVKPMSPADVVIALYALLATDREDAPREETPGSLRRILKPGRMVDYQRWMLPVIYAGFDLPGELVEAATKAAGEPLPQPVAADGTGTKRLRSRSGQPGFRQRPSGG